jgi:hypothetical protein
MHQCIKRRLLARRRWGWIARGGVTPLPSKPDYWLDRTPEGQSVTMLGYIYRFISNFTFLAMVYFSLNFLAAYQQRAIVAFLVLVYTAMRVVSTLRQFNFFQKIERLEAEMRSLAAASSPDGQVRKPIIREVGKLRQEGELKAYIDLLFFGLIALLCVSKIVTS